MFSKKIQKRGFTLIEMLIVIVIIGILAAALIPRLLNARGRANDTARKADLQQIATVLVAYQIDNGSFPQCPLGLGNPCELKDIADELTKAGMSGLPTDPNTSRDFYGISDLHAHDGQFAYTTVKKGGVPNNGFIIMAASETEGGSNYVVENSANGTYSIDSDTDISTITLCKTIDQGTLSNTDGVCEYDPDEDQLRYIFMY